MNFAAVPRTSLAPRLQSALLIMRNLETAATGWTKGSVKLSYTTSANSLSDGFLNIWIRLVSFHNRDLYEYLSRGLQNIVSK